MSRAKQKIRRLAPELGLIWICSTCFVALLHTHTIGPPHNSDSRNHIQRLDNKIKNQNWKSKDSNSKNYMMRPKIGTDQRMKTNDWAWKRDICGGPKCGWIPKTVWKVASYTDGGEGEITENKTLLLTRTSLRQQLSRLHMIASAKEGFTFIVVNNDLILNPIL